eukprot:GHVS01101605.1.p1 GENE.GHVS01101605.1~~GHVS01101605.1.p1  ORF type:complete len:134 (+),score=10.89 GHVS01101605.1:76-477(+)
MAQVNMQVKGPVCDMSLDLYNSKCFEFVLPKVEQQLQLADDEDILDVSLKTRETASPPISAEQLKQLMDLPSSWCQRLEIPRDSFHARCYSSEPLMETFADQCVRYVSDDLVQMKKRRFSIEAKLNHSRHILR